MATDQTGCTEAVPEPIGEITWTPRVGFLRNVIDTVLYGSALLAILTSGYFLCTFFAIWWNSHHGAYVNVKGLTHLLLIDRFGTRPEIVFEFIGLSLLSSAVSFALASRRGGGRIARAVRRASVIGFVLEILTVVMLLWMSFERIPTP